MTEIPMLRQSERGDFKRCPQRWYWNYREGLTPLQEDRGARWFGTGMHLVMAEWYIPGRKRGRDMHETWDEFTDGAYETVRLNSLDPDVEATFVDAKALGHMLIDNYLKRYGHDENLEVICAEERFSVLIPHPRKKNADPVANNVGTFDLIVRDLNTDYIWLLDHKFVSQIRTRHLTLDDQNGSYSALATFALRNNGMIGPKESVRGMLYNFVRKAKPDDRPMDGEGKYHNKPLKKHYLEALVGVDDWDEPTLKKKKLDELESIAAANYLVVLGDVSKDQGTPIFVREPAPRSARARNRQIKRIGEEALVMDKFRRGVLPIYKTPTSDCTFCDFFELCEIDEEGGDVEHFKESVFKVRDPYADHREGAENSKSNVTADQRLKKGNNG